MRVTSIRLCSGNDDIVVEMSFRDPGSLNPYIAKGITGLDAEEIVPRFYHMPGGQTKKKFFDLTIASREISIEIFLNPRYGDFAKSYSDLRDDIYRSIAATRTSLMHLKFFDGSDQVATIAGFVIKVETEHFSEAPELKLTLRCDDPTLRAPERVKALYLNEADTPPGDPLPQRVIVDDSTAPHGFRFKAVFTAPTEIFYIMDEDVDTPEWSFTARPVTPFAVGNILEFSSEAGDKILNFMTSEGSGSYNIIDRIEVESLWPIFFPGENSFVHSPQVNLEYLDYYPTYWGI